MDPMYSGDLFIDGYHTIKTESMGGSGGGGGGGMESNSVPIPVARRPANLEYLFETSPCGSSLQEHLLTGGSSLYSGPSVWSPRSEIKMDDDDILQVDESDLIQGPTLAELNANDETLLEDLNFDDLLLPEEKSYLIEVDSVRVAEPQPTQPVVYGSVGPLHELLLQTSPVPMAGASSPVAVGSRLSSSAPTHLGIWQRREPRPHLLSTSSLAEATSTSSLSTGGVMSPEAYDFSLDEGFDSEDDSDHYEDFSSDAESVSDGEGGRSKKERFFWQYNVQAKGPKGQRLVLKQRQEDPHFLDEVTDPVFSPQCSVQGIKHSGKARKGDGNDLTPNPRKLHAIGRELEKLGRIINDMTPVSELPFSARPKTRKEKNKLASRACRLKKKAQHEANKIKLCGLESEHKRLMTGIQEMKQLLMTKVSNDEQEVGKMADKVVKNATKLKIAGQSTEFVNRILDKVKSGVAMGGLDELYH